MLFISVARGSIVKVNITAGLVPKPSCDHLDEVSKAYNNSLASAVCKDLNNVKCLSFSSSVKTCNAGKRSMDTEPAITEIFTKLDFQTPGKLNCGFKTAIEAIVTDMLLFIEQAVVLALLVCLLFTIVTRSE